MEQQSRRIGLCSAVNLCRIESPKPSRPDNKTRKTLSESFYKGIWFRMCVQWSWRRWSVLLQHLSIISWGEDEQDWAQEFNRTSQRTSIKIPQSSPAGRKVNSSDDKHESIIGLHRFLFKSYKSWGFFSSYLFDILKEWARSWTTVTHTWGV